jgi:diaminopimelate epimerase
VRNGFYKAHGLGNDYLVLDPEELDFRLTPARVQLLCDRHDGLGGDGILYPAAARHADFAMRGFNRDGREAEKAGHGLRVFARYLYATRRTRRTQFTIETRAGVVAAALHLDDEREASRVSLEMGRASFRPADLPCALEVDEVVDEPVRVGSRSLRFTGVSLGNPHCVVFHPRGESWQARELQEIAPALETHHIFPRFINVQLAAPLGPHEISVLAWERGAGATQASGASACAAACAAIRVGLASSPVTVRMPGGELGVQVSEAYDVTLSGPVEEVARGQLAPSFVRALIQAVPRRRDGRPS